MSLVQAYFEKALSKISSEENISHKNYKIGKRFFRVNYNSDNILKALGSSISHLTVFQTLDFNLEIFCMDLSVMKHKIYKPSWVLDSFVNGYSKKLDTKRFRVFYPSEMNRIYLFDQKLNIGLALYNKIEQIPWWEKTFSFRYIFHCWTLGFNAQLIHSGAIKQSKKGAYLITGASGSGKSTSCLSLLRGGFGYLGDDYVWIEKEKSWMVYCLYQTAKIVKSTLYDRFPDLKKYVLNKNLIGSEKYVLDLGFIYPKKMCKKAKILGILIPQINHSEESIISKTNSQSAILSIAPTTLYHLPHSREIAYKKIMNLCVSMPKYHWNLSQYDEINSKAFSKFKLNE